PAAQCGGASRPRTWTSRRVQRSERRTSTRRLRSCSRTTRPRKKAEASERRMERTDTWALTRLDEGDYERHASSSRSPFMRTDWRALVQRWYVRTPGWSMCLTWVGAFACALSAPLASQGRPVASQAHPPRVAIILDRENPRLRPLIEAFQREVLGFFRSGEITLAPPVAGDGTASGIATVVHQALQDSSVAVVVALGSIGSHLLASSPTLPKPVIAGVVIDASWQGIPLHDGLSCVRNVVYVDQSSSVGNTLVDFPRLIPFHKLAVLLDQDLLAAIPQLKTNATALVHAAGAEAAIVPSGGNPDEILSALPAGTDAVYLAPLPAMTDEGLTRLLSSLNALRLPTLSYLAHPPRQAGALASYE